MKYVVTEAFGKSYYGFIFNVGDIISSVSESTLLKVGLDPEKKKGLFIYLERGHGSSCIIRTMNLLRSDKVKKYED